MPLMPPRQPIPMPPTKIGAPAPQTAAQRPAIGAPITTAPGQSLLDAMRARTSQQPQQVMQTTPPKSMGAGKPLMPAMPAPLTGPPGRMPPNLQGGTAPMPMPPRGDAGTNIQKIDYANQNLAGLQQMKDQAGLRQMLGAPPQQSGKPIPGGLPPAQAQTVSSPGSYYKKGGSVKHKESSQKQGDKINLNHSKVSTHQKNHKQPNW